MPPGQSDDGGKGGEWATILHAVDLGGQKEFMAKMRPVQFPISLLKASAIIGKGTAFDLSADGCAMESQTNLQAGDYVALQLYLPHQEAPTTPLKVDVAAVRWTSQRKVGLEFIQMPSAEQARLRRFLKSLETTSR